MNIDKLKKISLFMVMILFVIPCLVFAEEENENPGGSTPTPTPSAEPLPSPTPSESPVVIDSISLKDSLILVEGEKETLTVTITPSDATDKTITWSSNNEKVATVSQKGVVTALKEGTATIIAKSSNDKEANCVVTVTKKTVVEKSNDNSLKSLAVTNGTLDKSFDNNTLKYTVTVDKSVKELEFDFKFNHSGAKYYISNNNSIISGQIVKFDAIAEDGTKKTYEFTVKKEEANLNLKSLKIKGYALNETFSPTKLEYTTSIPYEAVDVTIETAPEDSDAKVKITGATGLMVGDNTVIITVSDSSGNERQYKIIVTRLREDEREITGNSSKYTSTTSDGLTTTNNSAGSNSNGSKYILRYVFVTIGCVLLFAIGGIGIYFYIITSTKTKKKKDKGKRKVTPIEDKEIKEESPLVETNDTTRKTTSIMPGDLEATREFRPDDIVKENKKKNEKVRKDVEELLDD